MSFRTTLALIITILLTVAIMQNPEITKFKMIFVEVQLPKLVLMTAMSVGGLLVGLLVSSSKNKSQHSSYPAGDYHNSTDRDSSTLSDEDRYYISEP